MNQYFSGLVAWLQAKFNSVSASEKRIMDAVQQAVTDVTASIKSAEAKLDALATVVSGLRLTVDGLNAKLAAQVTVDPAALSALATELNQHVASADAVLNPPATTVATPETPATSA